MRLRAGIGTTDSLLLTRNLRAEDKSASHMRDRDEEKKVRRSLSVRTLYSQLLLFLPKAKKYYVVKMFFLRV